MKGVKSNGFLPIIAQAIAEMEELLGEFTSIAGLSLLDWLWAPTRIGYFFPAQIGCQLPTLTIS